MMEHICAEYVKTDKAFGKMLKICTCYCTLCGR